ncbi:MAG: hypothetical protein V1837_04970 [Candidatus Woesearchaeota archaeon]
MSQKKIPISFNEQEEAAVKEMASLMGITGVYGDFPKALKFSITLALSAVKNPQKVYAGLNDEELAVYFQTLQRSEVKARLRDKAQDLEKQAQKV